MPANPDVGSCWVPVQQTVTTQVGKHEPPLLLRMGQSSFLLSFCLPNSLLFFLMSLYFFMTFSLLPTLYFHLCLYFSCSYIKGPSSLLHFGGVLNIPDIRELYIWNKDGLWLVAETKNFKWIVYIEFGSIPAITVNIFCLQEMLSYGLHIMTGLLSSNLPYISCQWQEVLYTWCAILLSNFSNCLKRAEKKE